MQLTELFNHVIRDSDTNFFIIDSGGYEKDIDFMTYGWHRHNNNKIKAGDVFIYRKPQKFSTNGQFYFYGSGQFGEVSGDDVAVGRVINAHPFVVPIMQSDLETFSWKWKQRGETWEHYWNQYGINQITREDFMNLLNLLENESHQASIDREIVQYSAKIATGDYFVADELALGKVRTWQQAWSRKVKDAYGFCCAMCDISTPSFLIGSHIIPVRYDPNNRMNPSNGLCLCVLHDKAFDSGFVSVKESRIIYSPLLNKDDQLAKTLRGVTHKSLRRPKYYGPDEVFLKFHRDNVFQLQ